MILQSVPMFFKELVQMYEKKKRRSLRITTQMGTFYDTINFAEMK